MIRKLASVRKILAIDNIEGADAIDVATIDGWKVVVKKGEFNVGDLVVYLEVDSWVPHELAPFLSGAAMPREYNGIKGERLKTKKLRGVVSQGLILPLNVLAVEYEGNSGLPDVQEGDDVTDLLGIQKWEGAQLNGQLAGTFPVDFVKSDQERAQNLVREIFTYHKDERYEVTLKLDGSSMSVFNLRGNVGVASRNQWLKINEDNMGNGFVKTAVESRLVQIMESYTDMLVQGELMGPGVQKNRESLQSLGFWVYNVQRVGNNFLSPAERENFFNQLIEAGAEIYHVPVVHASITLAELGINNIEDLIAYADKPSMSHKIAEGFVFKSHDSGFQFKIINNTYLLREK